MIENRAYSKDRRNFNSFALSIKKLSNSSRSRHEVHTCAQIKLWCRKSTGHRIKIIKIKDCVAWVWVFARAKSRFLALWLLHPSDVYSIESLVSFLHHGLYMSISRIQKIVRWEYIDEEALYGLLNRASLFTLLFFSLLSAARVWGISLFDWRYPTLTPLADLSNFPKNADFS